MDLHTFIPWEALLVACIGAAVMMLAGCFLAHLAGR